jgi:MFS family permease
MATSEEKKLMGFSFLSAFAQNFISPLISIYALFLGATVQIIGMLNAFPTFASLCGQLLFVKISKGLRFVLMGTILWSLFWIFIANVKDPITLVNLITAQAFISAIGTPAWNAFLVSFIPEKRRGTLTAELNIFSSMGGFISSLVGGYLINTFGFLKAFFYAVTIFGVISILPLLHLHQKKVKRLETKKLRNGDRGKLIAITKAVIFLNFAVGIAGPMMPIFLVKNLNVSKMDIAILNSISFIGAILFFRPMGMLSDLVGRKKVMLASLLMISLFPLPYALASTKEDFNIILLYSFFGNIAWAGFNVASFSYLCDVAIEPFERSTTFFTFFTGLSSFFGNLASGVLAEAIGYRNLFILSVILRASSLYFFIKLQEEKEEKIESYLFPFGLPLFENFIYVYSIAFGKASEDIKQQLKSFLRLLKIIK